MLNLGSMLVKFVAAGTCSRWSSEALVRRRKARRVQLQPDDKYQQVTDEAANALSKMLVERVHRVHEKNAEAVAQKRQLRHRIGSLLGIVASIPSAAVTPSVNMALSSGYADVFDTVAALRGLVRQGLFISEADAVHQLEVLYEQEASKSWLDDSTKYQMGMLSQLMYCVQPPDLLKNPIGYYRERWCRFSYTNEVVRCLGKMPLPAAWTSLVAIGNHLEAQNTRPPEELCFELATALSATPIDEFIGLVRDGTFFRWCGNVWNLERISPSIAAAFGNDRERLDAFLAACRAASSPAADALASAVLVQMRDGEALAVRQGLSAIDAGRAVHPDMPAYRSLTSMFRLHVPTGREGQYEIYPKACNELRTALYLRAAQSGPIAVGCRRLLADVECGRRDLGRPLDEPRHPSLDGQEDWTQVLITTT